MSTTAVTSWATDLTQLGPIYPFVGLEGILWIAGLAFWLWFHFSQVRQEKSEIAAEKEMLKDKGLVQKLMQ